MPGSVKQIVYDKTFHCDRLGAEATFVVTRVTLPGDVIGVPAAIAHAPSCSGRLHCGAFPAGFPQETGEVTPGAKTGCPYFEGRAPA